MPDYQPPRDILEVLQRIEFEEALEPTDPRRVDTREARGSQTTLGPAGTQAGPADGIGTLPSANAEAYPVLRACRYRQDHGIEILCGGAQGHQTFLARRGRRPWRAGPERSSVRRPVDGDGACPSASPEAGRHRTAQGRHQRARDLVRREGRHARRTRRIHGRGQGRRRGFRRRPTARQAVHEFQLGFQGERDLQGGVAPSSSATHSRNWPRHSIGSSAVPKKHSKERANRRCACCS